jgi:hypothetical protein
MSADDSIARAIDAMSDVQRRSVQAAAALVERLVASVDGHPDADADTEDAAPRSADDDSLVAFAKLWRQSMTSFAAAVTGDEEDEARIDVSAGATPAPLRVALTGGSSAGAVEVWLHNPTADALDKLRVHCVAPRAHDGRELKAAITAEPDAFDLPARSSRGVTITVSASKARPGVYHGLVLVEGLPEQWLPIEITVP